MPRSSRFSIVKSGSTGRRSRVFETRARTAASRGRGAKPRRPYLPPSDVCRPPRDGSGANFKTVTERAECEAGHTSNVFGHIARHDRGVISANGRIAPKATQLPASASDSHVTLTAQQAAGDRAASGRHDAAAAHPSPCILATRSRLLAYRRRARSSRPETAGTAGAGRDCPRAPATATRSPAADI